MLQTAVRALDTLISPSVRNPIFSDSETSSCPNASSPTGDNRIVECANSFECDDKIRWAASAMLRPTPPDVRETIPGVVVCKLLLERAAPGMGSARAVMSTAADPTTTNLAGG